MHTLKLDWDQSRIDAVVKALEAAYYPASTRIALNDTERAHVGAALYDIDVYAGRQETAGKILLRTRCGHSLSTCHTDRCFIREEK
jgi:hypothetical protein